MKIVKFSSGNQIKIEDEIADKIKMNLINGDAKQLSCFSDQNGKTILIINLTQIDCIIDQNNII